jgi:Fur family ferric uptake transcriptional regulator
MKTDQELGEILVQHELKQTTKRKNVLGLFYQQNHALSSKMIEHHFKSFDRVTLYRLLNSFEEKGLIHKVVNDNGEIFYAKCNSCKHHNHQDDHIHFHCSKCEKIYCLEDINHSDINVPTGFKLRSINLAVYGICSVCS